MTAAGVCRVLCLNAGSSSVKFAVFEVGAVERQLVSGAVERVGDPEACLRVYEAGAKPGASRRVDVRDAKAAVQLVMAAVADLGLPALSAAGHRLVHGGPAHVSPALVDAALAAALQALVPFAPLHLPAALAGIDAVSAVAPGLPQVACFDTAFHRRMPEVAQRLPLPRRLWDDGIRRYGFHGLSYEFVLAATPEARRGRTIMAHLGNGASMSAVRDGVPVDTTMGLTPTGGFMMGTRSGDLDPGVLVHLARRGWDADALERLVDHESGLLGVSATTADMQRLLARRDQDAAAALAVEMFCYHLRRAIGSLAAALGGLDTLIFTGGIGEHAAPIRADVCAPLAFLGIHLDLTRNAHHAPVISAPDTPVTVRIVPTNEDLMIARHTHQLLSAQGGR